MTVTEQESQAQVEEGGGARQAGDAQHLGDSDAVAT